MNYTEWRRLFEREVRRPPSEIDLARAALLIATDQYPDLEIDKYLALLGRMADVVRARLPQDRIPNVCVETLNTYLFRELGFEGNRDQYYDPLNSYLNDVLERRTGLPITLSVLYIAIGRRLGLPLHGVGLPGHFIVKYEDDRARILIDPFNRGMILDESGVEARVRDTFHSQAHFDPEWLTTVDARYILARVLYNLKALFVPNRDFKRAWQVVDKLLLLEPRSSENIREMGLLSIQVGAYRQAVSYLEEYLLSHPDAPDADQLRGYLRTALTIVEKLN
ncbi:MAG: transglutaminase-like domain-containing protein [Anaerolineae bacterium]